MPLGLVEQIRTDRRSLYVERFVQRQRRGGWLIKPVSWVQDPPWLTDPLARTHRAERTVTAAGQQATYYEFVAK
jgi:hypothetical protein